MLVAVSDTMNMGYSLCWIGSRFIDHPRSGVVYNFGCVCLSACLSVWRIGTSYLQIQCISREYGLCSYLKVIGSRSRSQKQEGRKSLFPQCQNSIAHNSDSIKDKAMRFACTTRFLAMTGRMVRPPSLSGDRKWSRVIKCTHSRMVDRP